ncbi:MAG: isoleucine--tRNA ligase [Deltaproteobacteria bacterium]|nr:isoleucine--tRNA ligase [Deltaproteobacteria bacterium]
MAEQDYKTTIHLPKTDFPMRANLPEREPDRVAFWEEQGIYAQLQEVHREDPTFLLHDGPPYANNHIHQGHVLNKVLKDIVVKSRAMAGFRAPYVPGWDCHGLPIELQVDKQLGGKKREMNAVEFRQACRAYAEKWVGIQSTEFQRLGVLGAWERPYLTMDHGYEARIVRELARFAGAGGLYKGKKPVYWCIRCVTALAEAEVEYEEHTSPSIYVAFDVAKGTEHLPEGIQGRKSSLVIWTTTPWTLPANLAIAIHPEFEYVAYELKGRACIVAKPLLHAFLSEVAPDELKLQDVSKATEGLLEDPVAALKDPAKVLAHLDAETLSKLTYAHPLFEDQRERPVLPADHVTLEAGTGLVHTAPGHGVEDYQLGLAAGLEIYNPVDDYGRYIDDVPEGMADLRKEKVFAANPQIVARLEKSGHLLSPKDLALSHSYPHCWRCNQPVIFRATHQWFISMEENRLREKALGEVDRVQWIPHWGRDRIHGMLTTRPDWCISRQRAWGVPIPVFYCEDCDEPVATEAAMNQVADAFEKEGADAWYAREPQELVPGLKCGKCGCEKFKKEQDILDVWFDSGVSYAAVCESDESLGLPIDLYLEGSDQHRGWFHSTLLAAVGTRGEAPYRSVLTHGFVVDGEGKKLSKKKSNYTPPEQVLKTRGAEILRLWVASEDYRGDIRYSDEILDRLSEGYRKIRNTLRFALGNLAGFDPSKDALPEGEWSDLERWAWARFDAYVAKVRAAYERYEFHAVYHATMELCAVDLSAMAFDIWKDRLYCSGDDWPERRAAQTVLWKITEGLLRLLAPILSFTTEEAWQTLRAEHPDAGLAPSVFLAALPEATGATSPADLDRLMELRPVVLRVLEEARREKTIGASLEAKVTLAASGDDLALLKRHEDFLPAWLIVSEVSITEGAGEDELRAKVEVVAGEKCARCWVRTTELGSNDAHPELCPRCTRAVEA